MLARKWCVAAAAAAAAAITGVGGAGSASATTLTPERPVARTASSSLSTRSVPATSPIQVQDLGLRAPVAAPVSVQAAGAPQLTQTGDGLRLDFYDTNAGLATYRLTYRTPTGTEVVQRDLGHQTSYVATGLMSGISYTFALTAVRGEESTTVLVARQTR